MGFKQTKKLMLKQIICNFKKSHILILQMKDTLSKKWRARLSIARSYPLRSANGNWPNAGVYKIFEFYRPNG
mgnify:CR=1 FL=1